MAKIAESVFIAQGAIVIGNVTVEEEANIWFHATVRADYSTIHIGKGSNIQDNAVVHVDKGYAVDIGENVTVGHGAIVHGCRIGDNCLIGMGAIILNGAVVGKNSIVGAGALITQNALIPDGSLVIGNPGVVKREVTQEEIGKSKANAEHYVEEARAYKEGQS